MHEFECLLSDMHNVAILWNPVVVHELETEFALEKGTIMQVAFASKIGYAATVGAITHDEWAAEISNVLPASLVRKWLSYFGDLNHDYVELLRSLKRQGMRIGFVTNATSRLEAELAHHRFADVADFIIASYKVGLAKPDSEFYDHAVSVAACDISRILYVDDDPSFVQAGVNSGLKSLRYSGYQELRTNLIELGLKL